MEERLSQIEARLSQIEAKLGLIVSQEQGSENPEPREEHRPFDQILLEARNARLHAQEIAARARETERPKKSSVAAPSVTLLPILAVICF